MNTTIRTFEHPPGVINQELSIFDKIWKTILDTSEKQVRDALIKMGWTPPPDGKENESSVYDGDFIEKRDGSYFHVRTGKRLVEQ